MRACTLQVNLFCLLEARFTLFGDVACTVCLIFCQEYFILFNDTYDTYRFSLFFRPLLGGESII